MQTAGAVSTVDKINAAGQAGRLSADEAILLKVQSLKNPESLPAGYVSDETLLERCGSRVTLEALRNWNSYSTSTQQALSAALARPAQQKSYLSPGGYFLIHYDTAGSQAVPLGDADASAVPDYVENLALYSDSSWRMEVLQLGYLPPPSDGDGPYDIYTQDIPYYGYAQPEASGPALWGDFSSYIVVHCNFFGFPPNHDPEGNQKGAMKVTIAHEFHHAVQFAYTVSNQTWFYEVTSTWMENVVFDEVDDNYNYLSSFFTQPHLPLTNESIHMYSCFIWNEYLVQNFGLDVIRQVWQLNINSQATFSLDQVLRNHGSNLRREFTRFTLWNYFTGFRDDGTHYGEGVSYPEMSLHANAENPASGRSRTLSPLAAAYERFPVGDTIEKVRFTFTGSSTGIWDAHIVLDGPGQSQTGVLRLISSRTGDSTVTGADSFSTAVLIAAQTKLNQPPNSPQEAFDYTYQAFPAYVRGDLNEDGLVNAVDIVFLLNYVFEGIAPPENRLEAADLDCSGYLSSADVVLLLRFFYLQIPPLCGQ